MIGPIMMSLLITSASSYRMITVKIGIVINTRVSAEMGVRSSMIVPKEDVISWDSL